MPKEEWVWNLDLVACDPDDTRVIDIVAELMGVNFQTAFVAVKAQPITVLERVSENEADAARTRLEAVGVTVSKLQPVKRSELVTLKLPESVRDARKLLGAIWTVVGGNRRKIAEEYPTAKEAPEQLYEAAQVTEGDLRDVDGAIKLYRETAEKFSAHKLGRKAADRAEKLESKKGA